MVKHGKHLTEFLGYKKGRQDSLEHLAYIVFFSRCNDNLRGDYSSLPVCSVSRRYLFLFLKELSLCHKIFGLGFFEQ